MSPAGFAQVTVPLPSRSLPRIVAAGNLVSTPKPASAGAMFEYVSCGAGALVYSRIYPSPEGLGAGALG